MEGLPGLVAEPTVIEIDGKPYTVAPIPVTDMARIERRILAKRGDPVDVAKRLAEGLSPEERRELFNRAYDDATKGHMVSTEELDAYRASLEGMRFIFWLGLRKCHPDIDEDAGASLFDQFFAERLESAELVDKAQQFLAFIAGMPEGNSSTPANQPGKTTSTDGPQSPGSDGSEPSPSSTAGPTERSDE